MGNIIKKTIDLETIEGVSEHHVKFSKDILKEQGNFSPMLIAKVGKIIMPIDISIDREKKKIILEILKSINPDWLVYMDEVYYKKLKKDKTDLKGFEASYRHGDMERNFKLGDIEVKEGMIINTYMNGNCLSAIFEIIKKDNKIIEFGEERKTTEAKGFMM